MTPLVLMFGAALVTLLVRSLEVTVELWRPVILGAVVGVLWIPMLVSFGPPRTSPISYPPYYPPMIRPLKTWFEPGELIMSDMPWAVAWYAERQSVLITRTPDKDFMDLNDWIKTVKGLYLTRITLDQRYTTGWILNGREWGRFMIEMLNRNHVPEGFPLRKSPYPPYMLPHYYLLADFERWAASNLKATAHRLDVKEKPDKNKDADADDATSK